MKLGLIGFGQAGGKIADAFRAYERRTGQDIFTTPIAVNTAEVDLAGLDRVPAEDRVLIGQDRVKGHGVGADNELGAEIAAADIEAVQDAIDRLSVHEIDAFLIVAGLGGGTGSGGAPVLAEHLKTIYSEPVFGLGVLPAQDEGGIYTLNAARSLRTFVRETDNLLLFDNDAWRSTGESMRDGFEQINREIARRFGVLFGAGEVSDDGAVAESVVDSSEIINTLQGGGISTVGYARQAVDTGSDSRLSLFGDGTEDACDADATNRITSLVREATLGRLTLPCDVAGADRALLVVSGPPDCLDRKGIERGRKWLESATGSMAVRGGDYPTPDADHVAATVLLSGVSQVPRVEELESVAVEAKENRHQRERDHDDAVKRLVGDEGGELSPLY
jgi:cell division GTPase FtsZ